MAITIEDIEKTKFQEMDDIGRNKFQGWCMGAKWCKFSRKSKDEFSHWDVSYYSGTTIIIGEIKDRNYKSDAYEDWILQKKKLDELKIIRETVILRNPNKTVEIHYINFFEDNEMMIWDITNLVDPEVIQSQLPKTYCEDTSKVDKDTIYLLTTETIINTTNG